jgi:hypothetical protein
MRSPVANYLRKRAVHTQWPLARPAGDGIEMVVVIPVLAESGRLFYTLEDLSENDPALLEKTLVLCVINNRVPDVAGEADVADNLRTLDSLPEFAAAHAALRLNWIDAASPGRELGPREGVGLARKIGLDWALLTLSDNGREDGALISLDGDTRVDSNYLGAVDSFFARKNRWAAVVDYAHPVAGSGEEARAILAYELFLRYQEMALGYAGSPYHYPAIGSTMTCTGTAYASAGGMNRRQAGEDFYFLQQLAKTGPVERLRETVVVPASRPSHRVPFGTGRKVGAFAADEDGAYLAYHPETYEVLRAWLEVACNALEKSGAALQTMADGIHPELGRFLEDQQFAAAWDKTGAQCKNQTQRARQFHSWFDGFRTLKLTHHLRDNGFPRQDIFESLADILGRSGMELGETVDATLRHNLDAQRNLVTDLRNGYHVRP